jgi:hypothetical protein
MHIWTGLVTLITILVVLQLVGQCILLSRQTEESQGLALTLSKPIPHDLPKWLQDYIVWHRIQRRTLNESNWIEQKYFVRHCLVNETMCAGASDRLRSVPLLLRMAALTNSLFFIIWERPSKLEEYLVPPKDGIDWRLPAWLQERLDFSSACFLPYELTFGTLTSLNCTMIKTQSDFGELGGANEYNRLKAAVSEQDFQKVYRSVWMLLFQPTMPIQQLISQRMQQLDMRPNQYNAIHIRSLYSGRESQIIDLVQNATRCARSFPTDMPFYIATDSIITTREAMDYALHFTSMARSCQTSTPLHLNRGADFLGYKDWATIYSKEQFYDTFVDLYLLANAKCRIIGRGSYGYLANLLSSNPACVLRYYNSTTKQYVFPPKCRLVG